ncbi:MAG: pilus assembly protein TadG-related protein, partial [Victivallaceae bacterium]|nr:pilus assembly protein TadG-related protein [Victivallaceae bacterium]
MSKCSKKSQAGQIIPVALVLMVFLLLAIFVFFDVHNAIRSKLKTKTAGEAAALAAANWQSEALNLVGEINLLKASTALTSDLLVEAPDYAQIEDAQERYLRQVQARCDTLTEMQTRIRFITPLVGYSAADQAAKNNGLTSQKTSTTSPAAKMNLYWERLQNDERYQPGPQGVPEVVDNYRWKDTYSALIAALAAANPVILPSGSIA